MTSNNQIIDINNDKYLIRKAPTKLILHHLPSLDIVHKYYSEVTYFCVNKLQIMVLYKNTLTFLKPKCTPLRLIQYQQDFLDWQPIGGLSMANMVILYDKSTIAFYYRDPKLQKSWSIDVIQQIEQVKNSSDQKFIALKVKQPKNTIFVWDMGNMSKKPNQQIVLKEQIIKWQFYGDNILLILTENQFKIYFVNQKSNQHFIQYYIPLPKKYLSFLTLNQFNQTQLDSGRKSVNTIAFLIPQSCNFDIVLLYDIEKRQKKFYHSQFNTLNFQKLQKLSFSQPIAGYQYQSKIHILGQVDTGIQSYEPKCLVLNQNFQLQKVTEYKQHQGIGLQNIQSQNDYVSFLDKKQGKYKLGKFVAHDGTKNVRGNSDKIKFLRQYSEEQIQTVFLTKYNIFFVNKQKKVAIQNLLQIQQLKSQQKINKQLQFSLQFGKYNSKQSYYMFENKFSIFFVCGIRYFKYDIKKNQFSNIGFVLKNQRAKLHQVRISTSSLVYKINQQYILIEYSTPQSQNQKVTFRTIKSSQHDQIISLRKDKWVKVNLKQIILGEGQTQLTTFNLQNMYKDLLQQNSYFEYDLYWTTHGGLILAVKNYLFFLQIIDGEKGSSINLIKKGSSYLHRRFSSSLKSQQRIQVIDPRNLVIYTGNRIVKLASQIQSYVTQNPYNIPDTLLSRQLKMRQYFCPHHPNIINTMLQNGWFVQIIKLMQKIYSWSQKPEHSIKQLYEIIQIEDYHLKIENNSNNIELKDEFGQVMIKKIQIRNQANDIQLLNKLCEEINNKPQTYYLLQNNPLKLKNILQSLSFQLENSRSLDFYSQAIITKFRLQQNKNLSFTTLDIAFLLHSINKDQALQFLKYPDHKMEWSWIQKYSIVLWYQENIQKWKKWIEEIAMTQFRIKKDPFDCLFWYILAGKKNLLITLFKAQKFSSKQHDAIHTFLQRDFQDPKHKSAALKNAYALIDKKRYIHAMAFLILADKKQECIRFAIDRLNDINLGYLIHLLSYGSNSNQLNQTSKHMIEKGDVWAQHIGWVQQKKHIASYKVLLKQGNTGSWDYSPQLKGFHPSIVQFSQKIKQSLPYKRELELKSAQTIEAIPSLNFDHLNFNEQSFDSQFTPTLKTQQNQIFIQTTIQKKDPQFYQDFYDILDQLPEQEENGFKRVLKQKCIKYYMRYHFPCLALTLTSQEQNKLLYFDAKRAYELEKYTLTGELSESVVQIAQQLDDIMRLLKNYMRSKKYDIFRLILTQFRQRFQCVLKKIKINELNPPSKNQIGQLLHYSYFSEKIFIQIEPILKDLPEIESQLMKLSKTSNLGKIISGITLKVYCEMGKCVQAFKQKIFIEAKQEFWILCKQKYDNLFQKKKQKHQKLMDTFELSLNKHIKKEKDDQHLDFSLRMPKSQTMSILLWRKIFEFLSYCDDYLKDKILQLKLRLDKIVKYWIQKEYINEIQSEIRILLAQGVQYRLKLNILSDEFKQNQLGTIEQLLKLIYSTKQLKQIEEKKNFQQIKSKVQTSDKKDKQKIQFNFEEKLAIEIFKNRSDNLKNFTLNTNDGKGLQIVVLFKKSMRKFQVLDNLLNRDRTKDGLNLIHQDNAYVTDSFQITSEQQMLSKKILSQIKQCAKNVFSSRKIYDGDQLIKKSQKYSGHIIDYLKQLQAIPNIDYHQIYSVQSHSTLPIYFLGGKGFIEVCRFDMVKNYNRISCLGMQEIVKIQSIGQRVYAIDRYGSLSCYLFDYRFNSKPIFELKKLGITDFACPNPSQFGCITPNSLQFYDTLLHPKRQCTFRVQMSVPPIAVSYLSSTQLVILRKQEVQIYDIAKDQLLESYPIHGRGRCLYVDRARNENYAGKILVGRGDCKIKIIDLDKKTQRLIKVGHIQQQKDNVFIESIKKFGNCYFCFRNDGSLYYFSD